MARISTLVLRVEVARRLVREEERRLGDERARDRDALLLAAGELAGRVPVRDREPDLLERAFGSPRGARARPTPR